MTYLYIYGLFVYCFVMFHSRFCVVHRYSDGIEEKRTFVTERHLIDQTETEGEWVERNFN